MVPLAVTENPEARRFHVPAMESCQFQQPTDDSVCTFQSKEVPIMLGVILDHILNHIVTY